MRRAAPRRPVRAELECLERARCDGFVRARGPLRRVLAALVGRMVAARSWEGLGFARSGDYARERLGLSARSLQDLARVDALLAQLPLLEAALVSGALTWTKVRLVARVAKPGDEARWIAFARGISARQLAREVRAIDLGAVRQPEGGEEPDEEGAPLEPRSGLRIACTRTVQRRWHFVRQLARRVAGEPVPAWQALENVAAEVLSAVPLEVLPEDHPLATAARPRSAAANGCTAQGIGEEQWSSDEAGAARELPAFLLDLVRDLEEADAFELDLRLRRAVRLEQRVDAEVGEHLLAAGPAGLEAHAREQLGFSPRKARGLLRVARAGRRVPELAEAWREGHISWAQAQTIVPALLQEPEQAATWIERATRTTVRRLEEEVEELEVRALEARPPSRQTGAQPRHPREDGELFWVGPADAMALVRATVRTVRRRFGLASDGEALGAMFEHAVSVWGGEARVKKAWRVFERDGWRCTAPGCSSYRELQDHHIVFRSAGGGDDEENRTTLCAFHHLRGVHGARPSLRATGRAPAGLRFELGLRPGRAPLAIYAGETLSA